MNIWKEGTRKTEASQSEWPLGQSFFPRNRQPFFRLPDLHVYPNELPNLASFYGLLSRSYARACFYARAVFTVREAVLEDVSPRGRTAFLKEGNCYGSAEESRQASAELSMYLVINPQYTHNPVHSFCLCLCLRVIHLLTRNPEYSLHLVQCW